MNKKRVLIILLIIISVLIIGMILLINKKDNDCTDCHTEYVESIGTTKEINLLDNMNMEIMFLLICMLYVLLIGVNLMDML